MSLSASPVFLIYSDVGEAPEVSDFRGVLFRDARFQSNTTLHISICNNVSNNVRLRADILQQVQNTQVAAPYLDSMVLLVNKLVWTPDFRAALRDHLPITITNAEVHIVDNACPGFRKVLKYIGSSGRPNITQEPSQITVVVPPEAIKQDGTLHSSAFAASLSNIETVYILSYIDGSVSKTNLYDRIILFITRLRCLRSFFVSDDFIKEGGDELAYVLSRHHPEAVLYRLV